jgi:hypothetical protein
VEVTGNQSYRMTKGQFLLEDKINHFSKILAHILKCSIQRISLISSEGICFANRLYLCTGENLFTLQNKIPCLPLLSLSIFLSLSLPLFLSLEARRHRYASFSI